MERRVPMSTNDTNWAGVSSDALERLVTALRARRDRLPRDVSAGTMDVAIEIVINGYSEETPAVQRVATGGKRPNFPVTYYPKIGDVVHHTTAGNGWTVAGLNGEEAFLRRGPTQRKYVSIHYLTLIDRPSSGEETV
jgi:hypothetical protein